MGNEENKKTYHVESTRLGAITNAPYGIYGPSSSPQPYLSFYDYANAARECEYMNRKDSNNAS